MAKKRISWRAVQNISTAMAGLVTALTGLYVALQSRDDAPPPPFVSAEPEMPALMVSDRTEAPVEPTGPAYVRTPWMGVELYQDDRPITLQSDDDHWSQFEATLDSDSFELRITRSPDDPAVGILAWHDDSIFEVGPDDAFPLRGTGIAGARFAVPILYLDNEGFNYYHEERLKYLGDDKYSIFVSTVAMRSLEMPLPRFSGPIYLVVFRVPEGWDREVPLHDYEFITLHRQPISVAGSAGTAPVRQR